MDGPIRRVINVLTGPYDAIHVGAAAREIPPTLLNQLSSPGTMFIPIGDDLKQTIVVVEKSVDGCVSIEELWKVKVTILKLQLSISADCSY
jgi:protein-L-isoaspartate O-methyltransferase